MEVAMDRFDPQRFAERLGALQRRRALSNAQLAKLAGISLRSLERLRRGAFKRPPKQEKLQQLAKALQTVPETLLSDTPLPEAARPKGFNLMLRPALRNALALAALHFRVTPSFILKMAPLAFEIVARQTLQARTRAIGESLLLNSALHDENGTNARLAATLRSIRSHDLFDEEQRDAIFNPDDWEWDDEADAMVNAHRDANPFVIHLKRLAEENGCRVEIEALERDEEPRFTILRDEALRLACGDEVLAEAILQGDIMLTDIPGELLEEEQREERLRWLRQKRATAVPPPSGEAGDGNLNQPAEGR
jgi:transcriptional regulator with XRE-family HTH domain